MGRRRAATLIAIAAVASLAACGGDDGSGSSSDPPVTAGADSADASAVEAASWQSMEIVDVDGASFTMADLEGKPVLVETFATWCTSCRAQLGDTQSTAAALGDEATVLALSVETDISSDDVASYATDNGFTDVRFAVMSAELLAALADDFGTSVANPPSTPKILVDAMGRAGDLETGPTSADDLVAEVRAAG